MVLRPCDGFIFSASDVIEHEKAIGYHLRHPIQLHPLASNWGLNWSWPQGLWVEGMMADLWVIDISPDSDSYRGSYFQ